MSLFEAAQNMTTSRIKSNTKSLQKSPYVTDFLRPNGKHTTWISHEK